MCGKYQLKNFVKKNTGFGAVCCALLLFITGCCICGCVFQAPDNGKSTPEADHDKSYQILLPGTYDSKDTSVLLSKNEEESTLTFFNLTKGKNYTLSYDGTTAFYDKYQSPLALSQVQEGNIVDVTFLKNSKKLNTLQISGEAWSSRQVTRFEINEARKALSVGDDIYKFSNDLIVMQDSKRMELMDINAADVLTISGIGTSVYSVQIERGHGYLRLAGDEYFIGGWIEVGQSNIQKITEDMLLTVPEGTYDVLISHEGSGGIKQVTINRNEEVTLDISDLKGEGVKTGTVLFSVSPAEAEVFVDGEPVDISAPVSLEYGIHQLMVKAEGYKTSTSYLKVAEESAGISIVLDKADDTEKESDTNNNGGTTQDKNQDNDNGGNNSSGSVSGNQSVSSNDKNNGGGTVSGSDNPPASNSYKVYIDNPAGAEVYLDGNYIGVCPVSFQKTSGMHVITLRKSGYETRSYTISVDNEKRDASYSFVELDKKD